MLRPALVVPALDIQPPPLEAQPDQGLVVCYRLAAMTGGVMRLEITHSVEGSVGFLSFRTVLKQDLAPGTHTLTARAASLGGRDPLSVDVVAGEVYYVRGEILWGWPTGHPKFQRVSASTGRADLSRMQAPTQACVLSTAGAASCPWPARTQARQ